MRRSVAALIVITLFTVGSSVAAARTSTAISIRAQVASGAWQTFDETTGAGEFGAVDFATTRDQTTVALAIIAGEVVLCSGGDTPDPTDDIFGFVGTSTQGEAPAQLTLGKMFTSAHGTATVDAQVLTVDECAGGSEVVSTATIAIDMQLTGISPVIIQRSHTSIRIPKQLRSKTILGARLREAAGTVVLGDRTIDVGGVIGSVTLRVMESQR